MNNLYSRHSLGFCTEYENGAQSADTDEEILLGTPGTIDRSTRGESTYFYRRYYDPLGKLRESYVGGPQGSVEGDAALLNMEQKIARAAMLVDFVKTFRKLGYLSLKYQQVSI